MSPLIHGAQYFLLAGMAFLAIGSATSALLVRAIRGKLVQFEARLRYRALSVLGALPLLTAVALLFSACLPSLLALVVPAFDHCPRHDDGHPHLCFVHLPQVGMSTPLVLGLVFVSFYAVLRAGIAAASVLRAERMLQSLIRTGERRIDLGVTILDATQPVCLAAGLINPCILMSRGLLDCLSDEERRVVLAHERAHVRRRDALMASVMRAFCVVQLPWVARWLVQEAEIAAEQICDEAASHSVGDRVAVASAILTVERAAKLAVDEPLAPVAVAFGQCAVERRVESLLKDEISPRIPLRPAVTWLAVVTIGVLVAANELHHVTESLLSVVLH